MREYYATVQYDNKRVSAKRMKRLIWWMKFRLYLRFPWLLFKRVKWTVRDIAPAGLIFWCDSVLMVKGEG